MHFDMNNCASTGIFIKAGGMKENKTRVSIRGAIENDSNNPMKITLNHTIYNASGKIIASIKNDLLLKPLSKQEFNDSTGILRDIKLWSPDEPNLYKVSSVIYDNMANTVDQVENPLGFRYFSIDKDSGFYLNGKHCFIKGVGRSQDYYKMGYAVSKDTQINDIRLIKDMGCNFLRAHYPQDPVVWNNVTKEVS